MKAAVNKSSLLLYAQLAFPLAFAGLPIYIHAPDFYATQYQVPLSLLGIILLCVRLFDAAIDPAIGRWSDLLGTRRRGLMFTALAVLALSFVLLFHPVPGFVVPGLVLSLVLATTAFSVLIINLNALGSQWQQSADENNKISTAREAFGLLGLLAAIILPYVLGGFSFYAFFLALACVVSGALFYFWWNTAHLSVAVPQKSFSITQYFRDGFSRFYAVYGLSMLASSVPAVLVLFFIRDRLMLESHTGLFLGIYFLSGALSMPVWKNLANRTSPARAWLFAMVISTLSIASAFLLSEGAVVGYAVICLVSGFAFGGEISMAPAVLSAKIAEQKKQSDASGYFGFYALIMKLSLALASVGAFAVLDIFSFVPSVPNTPEALWVLSVLYALVPAAIKILAVVAMVLLGDKNEKVSCVLRSCRSSHVS